MPNGSGLVGSECDADKPDIGNWEVELVSGWSSGVDSDGVEEEDGGTVGESD